MKEADIKFLKKIAKTAEEARDVAREAKVLALEAKEIASRTVPLIPQPQNNDYIQEGPTKTYVTFANPMEMAKHSPRIMQLNQQIHQMCVELGVSELRITFKK